LGGSPLFLCRKTSHFSGFYLLSTIGETGRPGGTKRYYQVQKQAQLITVCSRLALVEFDFCKRYRMRALGPISAFTTDALKTWPDPPRPSRARGNRRKLVNALVQGSGSEVG
jgi:hypothetical protein